MSANCPQCGEPWGTHGTACRITGAAMPVGRVELPGASHTFPAEWPNLQPPKPPKRVAVQASVYADRLTVRIVITANDGTVWLRSRENWTRLPDLPQD